VVGKLALAVQAREGTALIGRRFGIDLDNP
jgi:hypothetical protein